MKIINKSKNTIYLQDSDTYIPYENGEPIEIDSESLKKSKSLRNAILSDMIDIVEHNEQEQIEISLKYLKNKSQSETKVSSEPIQIKNAEPINGIEVKIKGIFYDAGGYAKVNRNLAIKLHNAGIKVQVDPKNSYNQLNEDELKPIIELAKTTVSRNAIIIDSVIPSFAETGNGKYKILYTTIESYSVPKQFLECCQLYDEIWVTSPFAHEILSKDLKNKPIYIIPAGVDETLYKEDESRFDFKPEIKDFIFISVFGWNYRKGYDVLLKAYLDEFSEDDNVSLLLVSRYQGGYTQFHKDKIKNDINDIMKEFPNKNLPHIVRYNKVTAEKDMPKLYRSADAFVLTTRGESSCMPPVEAALCGLPVIMTNVSGQTMYLREDNAFLIPMDKLIETPKGKFGIHYWDNQKFPDLTSKETHNITKQQLRKCYNNYDDAKERNKKMQKLILNNYTWTHTANAAIERLNIIYNKLQGNCK